MGSGFSGMVGGAGAGSLTKFTLFLFPLLLFSLLIPLLFAHRDWVYLVSFATGRRRRRGLKW